MKSIPETKILTLGSGFGGITAASKLARFARTNDGPLEWINLIRQRLEKKT